MIQRTGNFNRQADVNSGMVMLPLKLWGERPDTADADRAAAAHAHRRTSPACASSPRTPGGLGGGGKPVQIVLQGAGVPAARGGRGPGHGRGRRRIRASSNLEMDYQERQPQLRVGIDRNKAADLGVSLTNVGRALETMLGSRVVTTFLMGGDEYNVVLQARDEQRASVNDLDNIYVRSDTHRASWCRWRASVSIAGDRRARPSCGASTACAR